LKSGIPIIKAIRIATPILNNELIRQEFVHCQKDLESGASIGNSLKTSALIPGMVADLITVGEEAGLLEEVLRDIADSYEQETNETIKTMTTLLEPAMILIVGLVVGFIVIAMLLPIFQIDVVAH
jgi:type II secretory pathway component PulF